MGTAVALPPHKGLRPQDAGAYVVDSPGVVKSEGKRGKKSKSPRITSRDFTRIRRKLTGSSNPHNDGNAIIVGYCCSAPWAEECIRQAESGRVQPRRTASGDPTLSPADLFKSGVYPPGGAKTAMGENERTLRFQPRDYKGSLIEEQEDLWDWRDVFSSNPDLGIPSSNSAAVIDQIRHLRSRPERNRAKEAKHASRKR